MPSSAMGSPGSGSPSIVTVSAAAWAGVARRNAMMMYSSNFHFMREIAPLLLFVAACAVRQTVYGER